MKKMKLFGTLLCTACLLTGSLAPAATVRADAMKVVTLGADLTQEQKNTMMRYFKVSAGEVQILTITNQDERDHLSSYVPLEQIGSRTVSCAYVKPTQSGGIKVRTANLNWVTCNMIATTLSTSGVTNCEVVAACPFEVSGTGALTGIQMAYETASGEKLDETKKEIATEEMVVTGNLADEVGQNDATTVINEAKMQVIADNIQNAEDIYNVVVNIADNNGVSITEDQINTIVGLLEQIVQQNYDYADMEETLERVQENVTGESETVEIEDPDSIVGDLDESILGDDVIADSTEDPTLAEETQSAETEEPLTEEPLTEETLTEGETEIPDDTAAENTEETQAVEGTGEEATGEEEIVDASELNTDFLTEESRELFEKAKTFCAGEFEGDTEKYAEAMGEGAYSEVAVEYETGKKLENKLLNKYLSVLGNGTASYVPSDDDKYITTELNMMAAYLKEIFGLEPTDDDTEEILANVNAEERQLLYDETMKFFEQLYGETFDETYAEDSDEMDAAAAEDETYSEELPEEEYTEESGEEYEEPVEE